MGNLATVVFSIDLELEIERQSAQRQERLAELGSELLRLFERQQIPATWAVADPAVSAATEGILASPLGHEVAVLGDRSWIGYGCGQARLGRELGRRFAGARRAGIAAKSLILHNVYDGIDFGLLQDHGVTALRLPGLEPWAEVMPRPISSVDSIWQTATAWQLPSLGAWWFSDSWRVARMLRLLERRSGRLHLAIDGARLVEWGELGLRRIEQVLWAVAARVQAGGVQIQTVAAEAAHFLRRENALPAYVGLRDAA